VEPNRNPIMFLHDNFNQSKLLNLHQSDFLSNQNPCKGPVIDSLSSNMLPGKTGRNRQFSNRAVEAEDCSSDFSNDVSEFD